MTHVGIVLAFCNLFLALEMDVFEASVAYNNEVASPDHVEGVLDCGARTLDHVWTHTNAVKHHQEVSDEQGANLVDDVEAVLLSTFMWLCVDQVNRIQNAQQDEQNDLEPGVACDEHCHVQLYAPSCHRELADQE